MNLSKCSPKLLIGILIAIFFGVALFFRAYFPYDQVFTSGGIKFTGVDAYFQMRLVDGIVHNFPHLASFDPYAIYPGIQQVGSIHFFNWLLAGIIWVIGLGSPSQHLIDVVGVYFPAVLGALVVIPVYFIGRELFNRWVGVLSAALIAILPGEFIGRSILGFTDHHIAEVLFSTVAVLFLILAVKAARQRGLTFSHLKHRDWGVSTRPLVYALLAGLFLGAYLITWAGALLFVFIIALYLIIQFIIDHLRQQSTDYLSIVGILLFFIALIIYLPFSQASFFSVAIIIALLLVLVLSGVSRLMIWRGIRPVYYPLGLLGLGLVGLAIFYAVDPHLVKLMLRQFSILNPVGDASATTLEMQPIFFPGGKGTTAVVWGNFATGFYFGIISLGVLLYLAVKKQGSAERNLFLVCCIIILLATLGQRRFAYYFAVNVAVLTGYFSWQFLQMVNLLTDWFSGRMRTGDFGGQLVRSVEMSPLAAPEGAEPDKPKKRQKEQTYTLKYVFIALAVIVVFVFVYVFNIAGAIAVARQARFAPSDGWQSSLTWMKENTPEPFGDPDAYYQLHQPPPRPGRWAPPAGAGADELGEWFRLLRKNGDYPESAYGVLAWWDYGYWITRIAHRLPNANPGQNVAAVTLAAHFFLSQEESSAREIMQNWDSSYVVLDHMTTTTKFWAIATWAGREETEFIGIYYLPQEGDLVPINLFHPEYYYSMGARLYNFDGKAVTPEMTIVVSYEEKVIRKGQTFKQLTDIETFPSYDEALDFMEGQESANYMIVGHNPFISPVPLEALKDYRLVHSSDTVLMQGEAGAIPEVKIFEYIGDR